MVHPTRFERVTSAFGELRDVRKSMRTSRGMTCDFVEASDTADYVVTDDGWIEASDTMGSIYRVPPVAR